jgi:hypothetical protein
MPKPPPYYEVTERLPDGSTHTLRVLPLWKGAVLVLTEQEWLRGLRRGKWWRRREAHHRRVAHKCREGTTDSSLGR